MASALVLVMGLIVAGGSPAQAAPVQGFEPGNIISDSLFYNGTAMSASEVQSLLNQKVPRCTIGDPGRVAGTPWGNTKIATKCLQNFSMNTVSKAADAFCSSYAGIPNETAAQIIAKVGKSCGISPKVLLVMLEKEQSLVSDSWPTVLQLDIAMGYGCPDSGPDYSANCDTNYYGFFNQVYRAAWQLKVYKAFPNSYNYKPYQTNLIQFHPSPTCGTSQVYIENQATAALYIYTPYRPNKAALDAGWGTGDSCSSYGNRNFYLLYTNWFGTAHGPSYPMTGKIEIYWNANKSWLGMPTSSARIINSNGGGRLQDFDGGFVYESTGGAAVGITRSSLILRGFAAAGGLEGSWGWPIAASVTQGASGNSTMKFQGGTVVEAIDIGVFLIPNDLVPGWESSGGFGGSLGPPIKSATVTNESISQPFKKNSLVKPKNGEAILFDSRFLDAWQKAGGFGSGLGIPTGNVSEVEANGGGLRYEFTTGTMFSSSFGVIALPKSTVLTDYNRAGGPAGAWGWPTGKLICVIDGTQCTATFENGVAASTTRRGSLFTPFVVPNVPNAAPGAGESVSGGSV